MTNLLISLFIKNKDDTKNQHVRAAYGSFAGLVGIITNSLISFLKILMGIMSGSIAVVADGINNLTDATSSLITIIGFRLSKRPGDDEHPYGHGRIEYIAGIIASVIVVVAGIELLKSSVEKLIHPSPSEFSIPLLLALLGSLLVKLWQWRFYINISKRIDSVALKATGCDSRNDCITTLFVLLSIVIEHFSSLKVDGIFGTLLSLFIIYSGIKLIIETADPLIYDAPDPDLIKEIKRIVNSFDGVLGTHDLVVHNYGTGNVFASIHIEIDADGNLLEQHDMIDNIEKIVGKRLGIELTAHLDPIVLHNPKRDLLLEKLNSFVDEIDGVYGLHDLRLITGPTHTNVVFDIIVEIDCPHSFEELTKRFQDFLKSIDNKYIAVVNFDRNYNHL